MTQKSVAILNTDAEYAAQLRKAFSDEFISTTQYQWIDKELTEDIAIADFALAQKFNLLGKIPVIVINADTEKNEVLSLRKGADMAFSGQPSRRIIVERVNSILRRRAMPRISREDESNENIVTYGALKLNVTRHECHWHGQSISLRHLEYVFVQHFAESRGLPLSRESFLGEDSRLHIRTVDTHIKRIRALFRKVDPHFNAIHTLHGIGYKFDLQPERKQLKTKRDAKETAPQP